MSPGLEFLVRCAAETGFRIPALEKVVRLGEVVGAVAQHPLLGAALALKGGTALNLAFGQPTRLSVDLDRKIYLNYRSVLGPDDRIEIDLNYLMRSPVGAPVRRPLWQPGGAIDWSAGSNGTTGPKVRCPSWLSTARRSHGMTWDGC